MKLGSEIRKADYPIDKLFLDRWSSRAFSAESMTEEELLPLFEAARWAPSSNNEQPWRFIYSHRETPNWNKFFECLNDFNKIWCKNASVLVCLIAKRTFTKDNKPNRNHMSDAGAAWENLALQANLSGYIAHGMAGYNIEKTRKNLNIPEDYEIVHMIAIGKPGELEMIPERMQKSENPNNRNPVKGFVFKGEFKDSLS